MKELIRRKEAMDDIRSLEVTITGLRTGKGVIEECLKHYRDKVLEILEKQPTAYDYDKAMERLDVCRNEMILNHISKGGRTNDGYSIFVEQLFKEIAKVMRGEDQEECK